MNTRLHPPEPADAARSAPPGGCCPLYHEAIELIGRRWTGAIIEVLLHGGPRRFSEIAQSIPELSDRLLSERMKELEARGVVQRIVYAGPPIRVEYALTDMGRDLQTAVGELRSWARRWLPHPVQSAGGAIPGGATRPDGPVPLA
jgi:DNA-binding HxlR family transcriptional regulator